MAETPEAFAVHRFVRDLFDDLSLTLPSLGCVFEGLTAPNALTAVGTPQSLRNALFLFFAELGSRGPRLTVRFQPGRVGTDLCLGFACTPFVDQPEQLPRWKAELFSVLEDDGPGFAVLLPGGPALEVGPPLSWRKLSELYGGEAQGRQVLDLFLSRSAVLMNQVKAAVGAGQAHEVLRAAHTLKGSARGVTALAVAEAALQLEMAGRSGDLSNAADLYKALRVTYDEFIQWVREGQR